MGMRIVMHEAEYANSLQTPNMFSNFLIYHTYVLSFSGVMLSPSKQCSLFILDP